MKAILAIGLVLLVSGCASSGWKPLCPGTRTYDPQTCRGERFQTLPNFENEALIRRSRGEIW